MNKQLFKIVMGLAIGLSLLSPLIGLGIYAFDTQSDSPKYLIDGFIIGLFIAIAASLTQYSLFGKFNPLYLFDGEE